MTFFLEVSLFLSLVMVAAGTTALIVDAQEQPRPAVQLSPALRQPPSLDGSLTGWERAARLSLVTLKGQAPGEPATQVRLTYDRNALYIHFTCHEPATDRLVATALGRDDDVWLDDSVDVFLAPYGADDFKKIPASKARGWKTFLAPVCGEREYWHLAVNSRGVRYDAKNELRINPMNRTFDRWYSLAWDPEWTVSIKHEADRWLAALTIPFKALGQKPPGSPERWRVNFCRTRRAGGSGQHFVWSPGGEGFHDTSAYGDLVFAGKSFKIPEEIERDAERHRRLAAFVKVERIALAEYKRDKPWPRPPGLAGAAKRFLEEFGEGEFADGAAFFLAYATKDTAGLAEVIRKFPTSEWVDDAAAGLAGAAGDELLEEMGKRLKSPDAAVRANALRALMQFALHRHPGPARLLHRIVPLIADSDPYVQIEAAYAANVIAGAKDAYHGKYEHRKERHPRMASEAQRQAVALMIGNLASPNAAVRIAAAWGLRNMGDESAVSALVGLLGDQAQSDFARAKYYEALGVITIAVRHQKQDPAIDAALERTLGPIFRQAWKDKDGEASEYGTKYFPFTGIQYLNDFLEATAKSKHSGVKRYALQNLRRILTMNALENLQRPEVRQSLKQAREKHPDPEVREIVARALKHLQERGEGQ